MRNITLLFVAVLTAIGFQASARCYADFNISQRGSTFTFYDSSYTVNGRSMNWDFGDGTSAVGSIVTHTYNTQDTFEVCLVIEDTINNCSDTICKFVSNVTRGGGTSGCNLGMLFSPTSADPYTYTFVNISNGASSYKWLFPSGDTSTALRPIYDFDTSGVFQVCLVGYDSSGNSCDTICRYVAITSSNGGNCNAAFTYTSRGLVNTFFSNAVGRQVRWSFGDGDTSNLPTPIHIYDSLGTYTVCLYVYDSTARGLTVCDSSCQTITIGSSGGNNCSANFTYSADSSNYKKIDFSNTSTGPRYLWKFGDGNTDTTTNPSHTYANDGRYTACLYVLTAYDSLGLPIICDSICKTVIVGNSTGPQCKASFYIGLDTSSKYNIFIVNNSTGTNSSTSYQWTFGDGDSSTAKNPTHQYASFGLYNLCLTITTRSLTGTCTSTYCDSIGMDSSGTLLKKAAFGITVIDEDDLVSTPELDAFTAFKVYPNPSRGQVVLSLNARRVADLDIQVINMIGQQVMSTEVEVFTGKNDVALDLNDFVDGLYFIKLSSGQETKVVRVVLEK